AAVEGDLDRLILQLPPDGRPQGGEEGDGGGAVAPLGGGGIWPAGGARGGPGAPGGAARGVCGAGGAPPPTQRAVGRGGPRGAGVGGTWSAFSVRNLTASRWRAEGTGS